ncbi:hypothetical protein [Zavarzinia sp.]|uniref:hypothetical protein n=1 Tax=Zavarzinia sp. TaxID=2027920 RepID=UPI003BB5A77C
MPGTMPHQVVAPRTFFEIEVGRRDGEILGHFHGRAIYEQVRDKYGARFAFLGLAPVLPDGRVDIRAIGRDQWLVDGALLYVRQGRPRPA